MLESSKFSVVSESEHTKLGVSADAAQMQTCCCGLTSAVSMVPTQLLSCFPSSTGQGEKMRCKNLCIKTKTGRSLTETDST